MNFELKSAFVHLAGNCDLTVDQKDNCVYTIGQDLVLKKIYLEETGELKTKEFGCDGEYNAIDVNPIESKQFALGGPDSDPSIYTLGETLLEYPRVITNILGAANDVRFSRDGKFIAIASNETQPILYEIESSRSHKCTPSHSATVLNVEISFDSKYLASTSTDGTLNIYSMEDVKGNVGTVKATSTISKEIKRMEGGSKLKVSWHPSKNVLAIPGNAVLSVFDVETGKFAFEKDIYHSTDICIAKFLTDEILLTASLDKEIRVWNFNKKLLLIQKSTKCILQALDGIISHNVVFGLDWEGQLHYFPFEDQKSPLEMVPSEEIEVEEEEEKVLVVKSLVKEEIPNLTEEKVHKLPKRLADSLITSHPQDLIHCNSTDFQSARRFLKWNMVGSVTQRKENEFTFVDIEFADRAFHQNIVLPDLHNYEAADLNYMGAALVSKAVEMDEDNYEDEEEEQNQPVLHFIPFYSFFNAKEWKIYLEDEEVEEVAMGANFIVVATKNDFLVFNFGGNMIERISFSGELVAIAAYENQIAYIVHTALHFKGKQALALNVLNVDNKFEVIETINVPISTFNILTWLGYTEEGMLMVQDSSHGMKALVSGKWIPLKLSLTNKFWIVGSCEYELIGVLLGENDYEPKAFPKPHLKSMKVNFSVYSEFHKEKVQEIHRMRIIMEHEKLRANLWAPERFTRSKGNPLSRYSDTILSPEEIGKREQEIEKRCLDIFNLLIGEGQLEKSWIFASSYFKVLKTWEIAILFCGKLKQNKLAEKMKELSKVR